MSLPLPDLIIRAALEAGDKIMEIYSAENFDIEIKQDASPLTSADKASHNIILQYLEQTPFPVISEESKSAAYSTRSKWMQYWLIDPLDGTKEFIKRNGEFTVNIAFIEHGVPTMGVVYAPAKQWLYIGVDGEGAWKMDLNNERFSSNWKEKGQRLPVTRPEGKKFTVVASRTHASRETNEYVAKLAEKHGELEFVSMGSSLKICLVAEGKADIYPRLSPTMEWDTAAGDAVARCAGCSVVQFERGTPLQYNKENLLNPWFIEQR
ncbi:3'(2'),5'-bisphosphate nucleotidase CysQ [Pontibacter pamirensis]|uniref:3'(2'),5'-bisphosphate nucleotidase CysQ n=1 Tax=Pontibacter pamirensis TaxID=2562824 RepID=UPI00138A0AC2|nr:3'(2'),5'-bisphosphate nucleotidase CysQ [Pontibacter pamirensis]